MILDGWGHSGFHSVPDPGNAVELARVPVFRNLYARAPRTLLRCSGLDVGLPDGLMGNSEVGHLNLGAGRIVPQEIVRIDRALDEGSLADRFDLEGLARRLLARRGRLHVVGLVSDGGVHSHVRHILGFLAAVPPELSLRVHAVADGRDASPTGSAEHLKAVEEACRKLPDARVATVAGRYWAMDRDRRWERTRRAWETIVGGRGEVAPGAASAYLRRLYGEGVTDEFVAPTAMGGREGMSSSDAVVLLNFRADRMRQLTAALSLPAFSEFDRRGELPAEVHAMTEYRPDLPTRVAFPPRTLGDTLGEVVSRAGMKQLRVAETEKYAHVTYFFNGGKETALAGEDRELLPSPRVATYDLRPEMNARGVAEVAVNGIGRDYSFVLVNFANADMVGHTGSIPAAVAAVETVDRRLGELLDKAAATPGWVALITADHGNCEKMVAPDGTPHTAHTTEPVDFMVFDPQEGWTGGDSGRIATPGPHRLADVAPTVLGYLGLRRPAAMTGRDLVARPRNLL